MINPGLTEREIKRYTKQIMLDGIGVAGQEKIKNSSVLVVGAGGLGCPVLQYLTAAGVGRIGIADFDMVQETNLQRQILYGTEDVGKLKSIIARNRLLQINSSLITDVINLRIDTSNAEKIFANYDMVVDATDNIGTRYAIDEVTSRLNKPMIHGSIFKHEGEVSVFNYKGGPSYRNFNPPPESDKPHKNPLATETGLFGVLPGITGSLMANEVLKIITENGEVLSGTMLIFNVLSNSFHKIKIK
jgi:sulfur-carrier protein adenylyltransferase/sulfurtransferase